MVIGIPDELIQLRDSVAKFVEREVRPVEDRYREQVLEEGTIPTDVAHAERVKLRQKSVAAGFYAMHMPEEVGGMGVNTLGLALCREAVCASALLLADRGGVLASVEGPRPMLMNLNEAQREEYLYPLMRAEREACFGLTEPDAGSDATSIRTKAVKEGEYWRINGRKHFITNGQYADFIQLFAVTEPGKGARGISFFLVDKDLPGVSVTKIQRTLGNDRPTELTFEDVMVHESKLVGEPGSAFMSALSWINMGRIGIAAGAVGNAQYLLDRMIEYAKVRVAFGHPIGHYQFVQGLIVDSYVELEAARTLVYQCAASVDAGEQPRRNAAMAKLVATEMVGRVADRAIQVFGGNGIMTEMGIEQLYRDVRSIRLYEGTSEVLKGAIAKTLGLE